ncbi:MAG: hypothetical protein ACI4N3_00250 [Alphaproteobacteria bacterium]
MKRFFLISTIPIFLVLFEYDAFPSSLDTALQKYCIPKDATYCSSSFRARYNIANDRCDCANNTYLEYDASKRHCKIKCPAGSYPAIIPSCSAGSVKFLIAQ